VELREPFSFGMPSSKRAFILPPKLALLSVRNPFLKSTRSNSVRWPPALKPLLYIFTSFSTLFFCFRDFLRFRLFDDWQAISSRRRRFERLLTSVTSRTLFCFDFAEARPHSFLFVFSAFPFQLQTPTLLQVANFFPILKNRVV